MRKMISLSTFAFVCFFPCFAMAQNVVALFAPNLDFKDGAERNAYVSKIAKELSIETGKTWEGRAFARASDFEAAMSGIDVAILDADYYSSKGASLKAVAMLSANGQTTRPLKVIAKKGASDKLYHYRNKKLAIVANTSMAKAFVTASALGHEIAASDYFASIDEVRDVRSALNAVEMGKVDISLVFDGYDSGFTTVYTSPAVALPVVVVNNARMNRDQSEKLKGMLQNINIKTSSFVTGTTAYSANDAASYKRIANSKKSKALEYQALEPENVKVSLTTVKLNTHHDGLAFDQTRIMYIPSMAEFDKKLEQSL